MKARGAKTSSKHQVTILDAMREAGLEAGERVVARAEGPGRVVLEREDGVLGAADMLTVAFPGDGLRGAPSCSRW